MKPLYRFFAMLLMLLAAGAANATQVHVAVAANFTATMQRIAADFEKSTGNQVLVSYGSTGQLYAQIIYGAPFDLFLSADQRRPRLLVAQHLASDRFTYAIGKLVLWSSQPGLKPGPGLLKSAHFSRLAIANPKTAPYGAAAVQVLRHLQRYRALKSKLVYGNNIAQTYQFVASGNATLGFVAESQVAINHAGSRWPVPADLYAPIRQDAVLLQSGADNQAARAFLAYLKSPTAQAVIKRFGYAIDKG